MLTNKKSGVLYIGVTSNLKRRIFEHKTGEHCCFSKKYNLHILVYYEVFATIGAAIHREKQLKNWMRAWKINLIEKENPNWEDLYDALF